MIETSCLCILSATFIAQKVSLSFIHSLTWLWKGRWQVGWRDSRSTTSPSSTGKVKHTPMLMPCPECPAASVVRRGSHASPSVAGVQPVAQRCRSSRPNLIVLLQVKFKPQGRKRLLGKFQHHSVQAQELFSCWTIWLLGMGFSINSIWTSAVHPRGLPFSMSSHMLNTVRLSSSSTEWTQVATSGLSTLSVSSGSTITGLDIGAMWSCSVRRVPLATLTRLQHPSNVHLYMQSV